MPLKVIGTGFGRTGTDSMREALNLLGFGPCHHMFEFDGSAIQKQRWRALAKGASADWESLFEGYSSCVDWPSSYYWRELIEAYPEARIVHTDRSAESWWTSIESAFQVTRRGQVEPDSLGGTLVFGKVFGGRVDRAHAIAVYESHRHDVLTTVPPGRLLVHVLGQGWEPLCRHLGVPIPEQPYPMRNSAEEFRRRAETR
ncbi:sulfotransferase family protein [Mesorhizobium sp. M0207]|uniref:sulfotransferase family protein n=1 Tax=Mesorhizobium sp. M0207 TaxID=2956915 RepID=UPI00333849E1